MEVAFAAHDGVRRVPPLWLRVSARALVALGASASEALEQVLIG